MTEIMITLPHSLWSAIVAGNKSVECRKLFPKFRQYPVKVWVVEKRSRFVAGFFYVFAFSEFRRASELWKLYGDSIGVSASWFLKYAEKCRHALYLWHISEVFVCSGNYDIEEYFGVRKNPQSFVYCSPLAFMRTELVLTHHVSLLSDALSSHSIPLIKPSEI